MPISFRISECEVQVGRFVYTFEEGDEADSFQSCISAVNAGYCERKHPYAAKMRAVEHANGQPSEHERFWKEDDSKTWYQGRM
jgi:hypothetical protein